MAYTVPPTTVLLAALPMIPPDPIIRTLAQYAVERFTDSTSTTITLTNRPVVGLEQVFKNGTLLDRAASPAPYSIAGETVTLGTAPLTSDVFLFYYYFRQR